MTRLLSTGGTIAMAGGLAVPSVDGAALARLVDPGGAPLAVEEIANKPSVHLTWDDAIGLARRIAEITAAGEPVIVTHGTDLMEEVAFLCDLVHDGATPVVFTGAMRPSGALSADGPANLRDAMTVAADPALAGLGALVVFAGEVHAAREVRKVDGVALAAFASPHDGPIAHIAEGLVRVVRRPPRPAALALASHEPRVEIVAVGLGSDARPLHALAAIADGLVIVAPGGGHVPPVVLDAMRELVARMPIAVCPRPERGTILHATYGFAGAEPDVRASGVLCAGALSPAKTRVLLAACLGADLDDDARRAAFAPFDS